MKIIKASWVLTCDENNTIIENGGVVFSDTIIDVGTVEYLQDKYPQIQTIESQPNSIIMPGLVNPHVHLEFSANTTTLQYGNFNTWLDSVIANREELIEGATKELIDSKLAQMLHSGTTTIGAISSYGMELDSCVQTPINVVYFTEAIGSKADMIDTLFSDFKAKLATAQKYKSDNFIPAIAIHSPYSVHPFLIREVLKIAKENKIPVSAHFLESLAEREWLETHCGEFAPFFNNFLNQSRSLCSPTEFLDCFKGIENLSFTHCVQANDFDLQQIKKLGASIIHCPVSNRLLTNSILDLSKLDSINVALGTDGLSSNYSLNLFDEMRNALMIHAQTNLNTLAKDLVSYATFGGAKALGLDTKGSLKKDYDADILILTLPDCVTEENLHSQLILHAQEVHEVYIKGELC